MSRCFCLLHVIQSRLDLRGQPFVKVAEVACDVLLKVVGKLGFAGFQRHCKGLLLRLSGDRTLAVDGVFVAMGVWNDYLLSSLFLNTQDMRTLPMMIRVFCAQYSNDYSPMMAGLVMSILPMLAFYLAGQKQILEGVVQGSVKG